MDTTDELTQDLLHELFEYRDGVLYWKVAKAISIKIGDAAGSLQNNGYLSTKINNKMYLNHRLIFLMHKGFLPEILDHIDGNPLNNDINNLRPATKNQNQHNRKINKNNTTGFKGVVFDKKLGKFYCRICIDGKRKAIGYYSTAKEASDAIFEERQKAHGEFARNE